MSGKRSKPTETGCCMDCRHAYLMEGGCGNPVIALCRASGTRYAARAHRCARGFERRNGAPVLHEMIIVKH